MKVSALRLLALRAHTRAELRQKLRSRGHGGRGLEALLERLAGLGYLDDGAAARGWARRRLESRPMGRRLMEGELRARGVPAEILAAVLSDFYGGEAERELALRAAEKRLRAWGGTDAPRARDRLLRFLQGRGFQAQVCLSVADEVLTGRAASAGKGSPGRFGE